MSESRPLTSEEQTQTDTGVRIYDTPVLSLPEDLYIPPQAFAIWLEQFGRPFDFFVVFGQEE